LNAKSNACSGIASGSRLQRAAAARRLPAPIASGRSAVEVAVSRRGRRAGPAVRGAHVPDDSPGGDNRSIAGGSRSAQRAAGFLLSCAGQRPCDRSRVRRWQRCALSACRISFRVPTSSCAA
jgi:hypothetical protein